MFNLENSGNVLSFLSVSNELDDGKSVKGKKLKRKIVSIKRYFQIINKKIK
jgi:hypothetical protein